VRLDLHQNADRLAMEGVDVGFRRREEALRLGTLHDGGIVFVRGQHARGLASLLRRIIWKSDWGCFSPSRMRSALKIL